MAFGVNESEVTSRKGESSPEFTFPRILGIEAVGIVDAAGEGVSLTPGQQVTTMMGGLGRSIDGSYAEYTAVDAANVIPFDTDLPWNIVGALPQMLQTAHGSLTTGLQLQAGQNLLIRGGTSTVGLTAIALAHQIGASVIATSRNPARFDLLNRVGADHVVRDDDTLRDTVRELAPTGLDAALELVSATALPTTLSLVRTGGTACFVGALAGDWTIPDFSPFSIPNGVHLTSYAGEANDLPTTALNQHLRAIEAGTLEVVIAGTYTGLDEVGTAQHNLESGHPLGRPPGRPTAHPHRRRTPSGSRSTFTSHDRLGRLLYPGTAVLTPDRTLCPASTCRIPPACPYKPPLQRPSTEPLLRPHLDHTMASKRAAAARAGSWRSPPERPAH